GGRRVDLPTYAFQRKRFWIDGGSPAGAVTAAGLGEAEHPLLGASIRLAGEDEWLFTSRLSLETHPWLRDHAVLDTVLLPGTAFVELALAACERAGAAGLEDLTLVAPLVLTDDGAVQLQVTVAERDAEGRREVAIHSRPAGDE